MRRTAMKLVILSIILLVSISGTVLGYANYTTNGATNTTNVTKTIVTNTTNVSSNTDVSTDIVVSTGTAVSTVTDVDITAEPTFPEETSVPQTPVKTPKSPGLGPIVSVVILLSAMYIVKRR